jgi:glucose-1-phosphate thymidylyltransferase
MLEDFAQNKFDCMLALSKVPDPNRFGVPIFDVENKLIDVVEKPLNPPNDFAVTGIYLYGPKVFFDIFKKINKSARGEYEISDIHSHLLKNNYNVGHKEITGWWKDTGAPTDLILANQLLLEEMPEGEYKNFGQVENGAKINGNVKIGVGTTVDKDVKINGPVIIGENCTLKNCTISPNVTIGSGSIIENVEIANSIILSNCHMVCDLKIRDSIVGGNVQIKKKNTDGFHRLIVGEQTVIEL